MPTRYGSPTLYEAVPFPGAPRFFVRDYNAGLNAPLTIWGYSCRSTYAEDWQVEETAWGRQHSFPSVCFSAVEPDGEYGMTPLDAAQEVDRATLEDVLEELGVDWIDRSRILATAEPNYGFGKEMR
jgi:hypothetical protein